LLGVMHPFFFGVIHRFVLSAMQWCDAMVRCNGAMQWCDAMVRCNGAMQWCDAIQRPLAHLLSCFDDVPVCHVVLAAISGVQGLMDTTSHGVCTSHVPRQKQVVDLRSACLPMSCCVHMSPLTYAYVSTHICICLHSCLRLAVSTCLHPSPHVYTHLHMSTPISTPFERAPMSRPFSQSSHPLVACLEDLSFPMTLC